jgi:diguanylate cyclase (GGDEF)-like protein
MEKIDIFIFDDNTLMHSVYNNLFNDEYNIYCFKDIQEITNMNEKQPSLYLFNASNNNLQIVDIINFLKSKYATKDIPIIVIGPKNDIEFEEKCISSGAINYSYRPITQSLLSAYVSTLVNTFAKLYIYAFKDELTQIYNRRYFNDIIVNECSNSVRNNSKISLCMLDIDYFKLYNDNYGHPKGDEALSIVAKIISNTLKRSTDIAARYGGEEFVVVLPNVDCNGSKIIAEALIKNVMDLKLPHCKTEVKDLKFVTISVGVATGLKISDPDILITTADKNLYEAKHAGRNRYIHSNINNLHV